MLSEAEAKQIKSMPEWTALESHFKECVRALDSVSNIPDEQDHEKVAWGKKLAIQTVEAILAPFDIDELIEEDDRTKAFAKLGLEPNDVVQ